MTSSHISIGHATSAKDDTAIFEIALAGVVAAILDDGRYGFLSTVIGFTLLVVMHAYDEERDPPWPRRWAFAVVWGFCAMLAVAAVVEPPFAYFRRPVDGDTAVPPWAQISLWAVLSLLAEPVRGRVRAWKRGEKADEPRAPEGEPKRGRARLPVRGIALFAWW